MFRSNELRLDSSHPRPGSWPYIAAPSKLLLSCDGKSGICSLSDANALHHTWANPLHALDWMEQHAMNLSRDSDQRWIGFVSYDLGRWLEKLPQTASDDLHLPLFQFVFCDRAFGPAADLEGNAAHRTAVPRANFTRQSYCDAVRRVIDYIAAGDVFQVNLSQRFSAQTAEAPRSIYERLQRHTPAWYGALLDFGDHALVCNSPELFLSVDEHRRVVTRPIKGTRPLGAAMDVELRDSPKDQAELNMIVDLERNDLGRVCQIGTVKVTEARTIEAHPTVFHGAATIQGVLRKDVSFSDLLKATFPGGSVTGAPKVRAMQIIEELEGTRRGPYCGAIGYLAAGGRMEFNVAIRTMIFEGGKIHIPVGGGIVADSEPDAEYEETLVKARAMFGAI